MKQAPHFAAELERLGPVDRDDEQIRRHHAHPTGPLEGWPSVTNRTQALQPRALAMSEAAEAGWRDFDSWIEARGGPQGALRPARDFAAGAAAPAVRIARRLRRSPIAVATIVAVGHRVGHAAGTLRFRDEAPEH